MAFSRSLYESGHDEVRDDDVTDICSYCATDGKLQPALHFCFDCGMYGRYICGICLKHHNKFVNNHDVERIENHSTSRRTKESDRKVKALELSNGELQKDKNNLQKEKADLLVNIHDVKKENDKLTKQLHDCKIENKGLKIKIEEYECKSKKNENTLMDMIKEKDDLISRLRENGTEARSLLTTNENLQRDTDALVREREGLLTTVNDLKKENEKLSKEHHRYKFEYRDPEMATKVRKQESGLELRVKDSRYSKQSVRMCEGGARLKKLVVVAIEVGNLSSTYAYSFRDNLSKINVKYWSKESGVSLKIPTVVLFDVNKKFHKFGYEAEELYKELEEDGKNHDWYIFRRFMLTFQEKKLDSVIVDDKGKEMKVIDVLSAVIKFLKDHFLQNLKRVRICLETINIQWVLTVPAIWTDTANQIMKEAANKADITDANLTLASEPVAASSYCQTIATDYPDGSVKSAVQLLSSLGTKFMVVDLRDCVANFTLFESQSGGGLIEVKAATVEACGANNVKTEFFGLFHIILGDTIFQKCINEYPEEYLEVQSEIEFKIISQELSNRGFVTCRLPVPFQETFREVSHETIQQAIDRSQFKGKIKWCSGKFRIDIQIVIDMFKRTLDKIVGYIQDLLRDKYVQDTRIFLMVGEFCESLVVQEAIIKAFPNVDVIIPKDQATAVLRGAVIYGHQH